MAKKKSSKKSPPRTTPVREAVKRVESMTPKSSAEKQAHKRAMERSVGGSGWKPENEGESIIGKVLSMRVEGGQYGDHLVMQAETDQGLFTHHCNKPLEGELERQKIVAGDTIIIVYRGKVATGKGQPAKLYAVEKIV